MGRGGRPKVVPFSTYLINAANNSLSDVAGCWLLAAAAAAGTVHVAAVAVAAAGAGAGAVAAAVDSPILAL